METKDTLNTEIDTIRLLSHYVNRNKKVENIQKRTVCGAPKGHMGYSRPKPLRIDCIKTLEVNNCQNCMTVIGGNLQEIRTRYVTDIKIYHKAKNTRYNIQRKYCKNCKKIIEPRITTALGSARFGLNIMHLTIYLKMALKISWGNVRDYMRDLHYVSMSVATPLLFMKSIARENESVYNSIKKKMLARKVIYTDETRWPMKGEKWWVWSFSSDTESIFLLCKNRSHKIAAEFLKDYRGVLVCDFYSAYEKIKCKQQKCIIHLLREFQKQLKVAPYDTELREMINSFLAIIRPVIYELKEVTPNYGLIKLQKKEVRSKIKKLIKKEYISKSANTFKKRFKKHLESIIRFMSNPEHIGWNNNKAERDLRPLCIQRNISGSFCSEQASKSYLLLFSIYQTCERRDIHFLKFLHSGRNKLPETPIQCLAKRINN